LALRLTALLSLKALQASRTLLSFSFSRAKAGPLSISTFHNQSSAQFEGFCVRTSKAEKEFFAVSSQLQQNALKKF
jgi:hypothetical protein